MMSLLLMVTWEIGDPKEDFVALENQRDGGAVS